MKKILLLLFLVSLSSITIGQAPDIEWQICLGGSSIDYGKDIQQTKDGGYIVVGRSQSKDGDVTGNHGGSPADYWVVKLDVTGNIQWQKSFGGSDNEEAACVQQTSDDGYILAGWSESTDGDVTGNHGGTDYWVVKLDATGNLQWQKSLGGSGDDEGFSIQQTTSGGYIVAGISSSKDGDITGHHGSQYSPDFWVVKLDVTGNIQWQKSLGGSGYDEAFSIEQTGDNGYIVAGSTCSNDGDVNGYHGSIGTTDEGVSADYWVVKMDSIGNIQWQKSLGGSGHDEGRSVQKTKDDGYIVAGSSYSTDGDVTGHNLNSDYWVVKLDNLGNKQWQKSLGGSSHDAATTIKQTKRGGYIVAGYSNSSDGNVSNLHENNKLYKLSDFWIVKLDREGNLEWQKTLGGYDWDEANSIQETKDGGYVIVGDITSNDGDVIRNHGDTDFWVVKLAPYKIK